MVSQEDLDKLKEIMNPCPCHPPCSLQIERDSAARNALPALIEEIERLLRIKAEKEAWEATADLQDQRLRSQQRTIASQQAEMERLRVKLCLLGHHDSCAAPVGGPCDCYMALIPEERPSRASSAENPTPTE